MRRALTICALIGLLLTGCEKPKLSHKNSPPSFYALPPAQAQTAPNPKQDEPYFVSYIPKPYVNFDAAEFGTLVRKMETKDDGSELVREFYSSTEQPEPDIIVTRNKGDVTALEFDCNSPEYARNIGKLDGRIVPIDSYTWPEKCELDLPNRISSALNI